jgi:hypothetical protein
MYHLSTTIIQRWWRKHTDISNLKKVVEIFKQELKIEGLQELSNMLAAITKKCNGDGAGLASGTIVDMLLCDFFKVKLTEFSDCHTGECDMKISNIPLSLKKINGRSEIALDWSKNPTIGGREHFTCGVMIINLKEEQWWKKGPRSNKSNIKITYIDSIPAGIYLIDKRFCKYYVKISSNNKTNARIDSQYLYIMLNRSISLNLFTPLPSPNKELRFNILNAFL